MASDPKKRGWPVDEIAEWLITVAALALMIGAYMATFDWPRNAAVFPGIVSGFAAILLAIKLVVMVARRLLTGPRLERITGRKRGTPLPSEAVLSEPPDGGVFANTPVATWIETLVCLVIFFTLLVVVGILPTLALFCIGYLIVVAKKSLWFALVYAAVLIGAVYLLFVTLLSLRLPQGMLGF